MRAIEDYLLEWERRRRLGEDVTPADLCPDSVDRQAEIARHIAILKECDRLLDVEGFAVGSECFTPPLPRVIGRYEVRGELGRGGMGVVWKVWDPQLRREAALKMLRPSSPWHDEHDVQRLARRFQQEAQLLAQLQHEHIVPVFEPGLHDGQPFFVMQHVGGGSLAQRLAIMNAEGPNAVAAFMVKVAGAVDYAHRKGVLHRDLKPGNILMDESGKPLVSDFGLARLLAIPVDPEAETEETPGRSCSEPEASHLTAPGWQPGTAAYMAPEQFDASFGQVGPATDVWALGVILYELLTMKRPFGSGSRDALRDAICARQPATIAKRGIDPRLRAVVLRCLQKAPARRFSSAGELADALGRCQRRRVSRWLSVVAALLAFVALGSFWLVREAEPERRYERRVAPLLAKLDREETVDLISEGSEPPPYRIRCGDGVTNVRQTENGLVITSPTMSIVEFLSRVPCLYYRIEAEVRHDHNNFRSRGPGGVGVIFTNGKLAAPNGTHHVPGYVGFDDESDPESAKIRGWSRRATMRLHWYLEARENDPSAFRFST